jgi:hypothetical protein
LILDDVEYEVPVLVIPAKKPGGKSKRILYQSFAKGHFFRVFGQLWQKNEMGDLVYRILMCHFCSTQTLLTQ